MDLYEIECEMNKVKRAEKEYKNWLEFNADYKIDKILEQGFPEQLQITLNKLTQIRKTSSDAADALYEYIDEVDETIDKVEDRIIEVEQAKMDKEDDMDQELADNIRALVSKHGAEKVFVASHIAKLVAGNAGIK